MEFETLIQVLRQVYADEKNISIRFEQDQKWKLIVKLNTLLTCSIYDTRSILWFLKQMAEVREKPIDEIV